MTVPSTQTSPGAGPTRFERVLYAVVSGILLALGRVWFRIRVTGLEHVPKDGPYILAPVHRSNLDFLMVLACSKRRMRYLAKDTLWKPGWGRLFSALGGIPVNRGTADREALRTCIAVIEGGEPLVMFPEGTRQTGPEVCEMFDGPAFVQSRTGVPIVPVGIGGSEAAMPKGSKVPKPHRVTVVVGEPLLAPQAEGAKAARSALRAQTVTLKAAIQQLFDQAQIEAGTPNR
ncbi:MAG: putative acyltransferase [Acidimicrobiales bacterium]|nr:putative acyltransferase [Acidimicrobiales bacterium]